MTPYIDYYLPMNFTDGFTFADGRIKMRSVVEAVIGFIPIVILLFIIRPPANVMFGIITFSATLLFFVCTMGIDGDTPSLFLMRYINYRKTRNISLYNPAANKVRSSDWTFDRTDEGGIKGFQKKAQEIVQSSGISEDAVSIISADEILQGEKFCFKEELEKKARKEKAEAKAAAGKSKGRKGESTAKKKPSAPAKPSNPSKPPAPPKPPVQGNQPPQTCPQSKAAPGAVPNTPSAGEGRRRAHSSPTEANVPNHPIHCVQTAEGSIPVTRILPPVSHITFLVDKRVASVPLEELQASKGPCHGQGPKTPPQRAPAASGDDVDTRKNPRAMNKDMGAREDGKETLEFVFD